MPLQRRRRHHRHSHRDPAGRRRSLLFAGGILCVLGVAALLPLAMWTPSSTIAGPGRTESPRPRTAGPQAVAAATFQVPDVAAVTPVPAGPILTAPPTEVPGEPGIVAKRIRIERLDLDLPIIEGDGIDVPMTKAAHFPGTAWPGGGSNIYLYAHARPGLFMALWNARQGDQVVLVLVDGTTRRYRVDEIRRHVAWNDLTLLDPTPAETLTLQTCVSYGDTQPRFAVIAHPVQ